MSEIEFATLYGATRGLVATDEFPSPKSVVEQVGELLDMDGHPLLHIVSKRREPGEPTYIRISVPEEPRARSNFSLLVEALDEKFSSDYET